MKKKPKVVVKKSPSGFRWGVQSSSDLVAGGLQDYSRGKDMVEAMRSTAYALFDYIDGIDLQPGRKKY